MSFFGKKKFLLIFNGKSIFQSFFRGKSIFQSIFSWKINFCLDFLAFGLASLAQKIWPKSLSWPRKNYQDQALGRLTATSCHSHLTICKKDEELTVCTNKKHIQSVTLYNHRSKGVYVEKEIFFQFLPPFLTH